jgi:hypothetical protein
MHMYNIIVQSKKRGYVKYRVLTFKIKKYGF